MYTYNYKTCTHTIKLVYILMFTYNNMSSCTFIEIT